MKRHDCTPDSSMRRSLIVASVVLVSALSGSCGATNTSSSQTVVAPVSVDSSTVLVVVNATGSGVALTADLIVGPCIARALSQREIDDAITAEAVRIASGQDVDLAPGVVDFRSYQFAQPTESTLPAVLVITSRANSVTFGPVDWSTIPLCAPTRTGAVAFATTAFRTMSV